MESKELVKGKHGDYYRVPRRQPRPKLPDFGKVVDLVFDWLMQHSPAWEE